MIIIVIVVWIILIASVENSTLRYCEAIPGLKGAISYYYSPDDEAYLKFFDHDGWCYVGNREIACK